MARERAISGVLSKPVFRGTQVVFSNRAMPRAILPVYRLILNTLPFCPLHQVESDESSSHESDEDVPAALWMEEFEAARRVRVSGRAAPGGSGGASGSGPGQRRSAYVPPKGVSELATLPQRPSTSYSSSKGR